MTDFRALCAQLAIKLREYDSADPYHDCAALLAQADAALAQPAPAENDPPAPICIKDLATAWDLQAGEREASAIEALRRLRVIGRLSGGGYSADVVLGIVDWMDGKIIGALASLPAHALAFTTTSETKEEWIETYTKKARRKRWERAKAWAVRHLLWRRPHLRG